MAEFIWKVISTILIVLALIGTFYGAMTDVRMGVLFFLVFAFFIYHF